MGWGDTLAQAYNAASDAARAAAIQAMSSARSAAEAVVRVAKATAAKTSQLATSAAKSIQTGATAVAGGVKNVASFGARAVGETATVAGSEAANVVTAPYKAAKKLLSPTKQPSATAVEPCPHSAEAKKERLERRNQMIKDGRASLDPAKRAAAERLDRNNEAVELARLSEDTYDQYPGGDFKYPYGNHLPPAGWSIVPKEELEAKGVSVKDLEASRAVVYRTPKDWPDGQKTVLAFRGTKDLEDDIVDYDQAMALTTTQYKSAMRAGDSVSQAFGSDTLVTGHSLGGGKAQAAGAAGGLKGSMFNAAGLNPDTVGGMTPDVSQFSQYRATGDPLSGAQNSPVTQTTIAVVAGVIATPLGAGMKLGDAALKALGMQGLSPEMADYADKAFKAFPRGVKNLVQHGNVLPPAIGEIHQVNAIDSNGKPVSKLDLMGQHSITNTVNGIEQQKTQDVATLSN